MDDDNKPRLGHWDHRTLVEPVRLLLALAEVDYEDVRYPVGEPPSYDKAQRRTDKFALGLDPTNLPYWIEPGAGGLRLTQSRAILYYLASERDLAGESSRRRALVLMAVEAMWDWADDDDAYAYSVRVESVQSRESADRSPHGNHNVSARHADRF